MSSDHGGLEHTCLIFLWWLAILHRHHPTTLKLSAHACFRYGSGFSFEKLWAGAQARACQRTISCHLNHLITNHFRPPPHCVTNHHCHQPQPWTTTEINNNNNNNGSSSVQGTLAFLFTKFIFFIVNPISERQVRRALIVVLFWIVLESPVRSGFLPFWAVTVTKTGYNIFKSQNNRTGLMVTGPARLLHTVTGYKTGHNWFQL